MESNRKKEMERDAKGGRGCQGKKDMTNNTPHPDIREEKKREKGNKRQPEIDS